MARAHELDTFDIAELTVDVECWPAGTRGTVVDQLPGGFFFEIADEDGRTRGLIEVPAHALKLVEAQAPTHRVVA